ncbi:NADH-quinone oxidoreductase subunit NuoE [Candidatus Oleimmundimicrobium sp.]|uniref:NADH-quinone oxidoreductase subunit NuoE n=1 Tax=Candidatus Oleimmundimicrobium sp. TaxID=3060597 RepID=UPI002716CF89|nr:NADH-quinone oxidoreductase subunit NuoE [Candidatus Oleimmundimicrobium sp.]MDO8886271.1 NADH-quinone oxidoreductase subunit NuoE [Candidatus Oleimmundimicrobium sp.]
MACQCKCGKSSGEKLNLSEISDIIERYKDYPGATIPLLQEIQKRFGYLSEDVLDYVSEATGIQLSQLYGVATFYPQFSLIPVGKNVISVCQGTACHVSGAKKITEALADELGIEEGETTHDRQFTLRSVACLGACSLAPVMRMNDETYGRLTPKMVREIIRNIKTKNKSIN